MNVAIYAFSGDPITFGHIDVIKRAASVFDRVIVAIGVNPAKRYTFTLEERTVMAQRSLQDLANINVRSFSGLLVDYAYEQGVSVIVKGVRNQEDFNYESILHQVGQSQELGIETHILFSKPTLAHVSSSAVKEIQRNQGSIHEYVPLFVKQMLESRISQQYIVGVTGEMGAGKSHVSNALQALGADLPVHNIELDHIGHDILGTLQEPAYHQARRAIAAHFGAAVVADDGFINRKALGEIVFNDIKQLKVLNQHLYTPINVRLRREMAGKTGIILVNAALLAETDMLHLCNNNIILIRVGEAAQLRRLQHRDLTPEQIRTRAGCQYDYQQKEACITEIINRDGYGQLWTLDNSSDADTAAVEDLLVELKAYFALC